MVKLPQNLVKELESTIGILNYSPSRIFKKDEVVTSHDSINFKIYRSLVDNNVGNSLTDTSKWIEIYIGTPSSYWGDIKGVLSNQSDLQNALNEKATISQLSNKANNNEVVHLSNEETITGSKTFTSNISVSQTAGANGQGIVIDDGSIGNTRLEQFRTGKGTTNDVYYSRITHNNGNGKSGAYVEIRSDSVNKNAVFTLNNIASTSIPTPTEDTTTSMQADTVGARNTKLQNYVTNTSLNNKIQKVSVLPATQETGVLYVIPE